MRKKKNLLPRMKRCARLLIDNPYDMPGKWRTLFPDAREIRVEIGCGKGKFTAKTAALNPDILFIGVEVVPEAIVVAMERCMELSNAYFIRADANQLPQFFAPGEADGIYLNFSDPWPGNRHAKRRLTHGNFLKLYRQILKSGGRLEFKTDNAMLFEFSLAELPEYGFALSDVTRNLHADGPTGVMTDYEAKFYAQGLPIYRLVGIMEPWEEPFPHDIRTVKNRWLDAFAADVPEEILRDHVQAPGNYLWHIFTWGNVACLEGDAARKALQNKSDAITAKSANTAKSADTAKSDADAYLFYYEYPPDGVPRVLHIRQPIVENLPEESDRFEGSDWYVTDKDFTWTYVSTHENDSGLGPYFCERK